MTTETPTERGRFDGPAGLLIIVVAVVIAAAVVERLTRPVGGEVTGATPLPELLVQGWLNTRGGDPPTREALQGRWVVIDSWATDCGPCLYSMPKLAEFHRRWRDRGVELVGLTSEPESRLARIEAAIERVEGWDWPVGYGAGMLNQQLGVTMIPNYILFDPEGLSVWRGHSLEALETELASRI